VNAGFREGNPVRDVLLVTGKRPASTSDEEAESPAPKPEPAVYDLEVIRGVLKQSLPSDLRCAVALAAFSGLRLAELNGMRWSDIDWEANAISVNRSVWHGFENEPKSKASKASVPIIPELATYLEDHRRSAVRTTDALFIGDLKALGRYHLPDAFTAVKSNWRGWHGFRRGLASTLFAAGAEDLVVQRVLRHSKVIVTREHYIKRFDQRVLDAMNTLSGKQGKRKGSTKHRSRENTD
jgi:integrase